MNHEENNHGKHEENNKAEDENEDENEDDDGDDELEMIKWADSGQLGSISPHEQFEFDSDVERESEEGKSGEWPWDKILSRWRHRLKAIWDYVKHHLFGWFS